MRRLLRLRHLPLLCRRSPPGDLPPASASELDMLENVAAERRANSRLACQLKASPALAGLILNLPAIQE